MAALPTPSEYPQAVPLALPPPASVVTRAVVPTPPQAADDAEALRLAVREAEAVALGDCEGDDVRDAVADAPARRDGEAEAEVVRLGEPEALRVRDAVKERLLVAETETEALGDCASPTEANAAKRTKNRTAPRGARRKRSPAPAFLNGDGIGRRRPEQMKGGNKVLEWGGEGKLSVGADGRGEQAK